VEERPLDPELGFHRDSPEARRRQALRGLQDRFQRNLGPASRFFTVVKRVVVGAWSDGFIHAGNLAYTAILALFPFFIVVAAVFQALGEAGQREASIHAFLSTTPPVVARALEPVALSVIEARSGWLLWVGGLVGLWTVSSLIETIRDILRRAYGTRPAAAFWRYRLFSTAFIVGAVVMLLLSLFAQVAITAMQEAIAAWFPNFEQWLGPLTTSRLIPASILYLSIYALFLSQTPAAYRSRRYPKWPGALLVTVWWVTITVALPSVLRRFFTYDLTYGSLAGVMITLFFFWLVGLGMVMGAELNAALAETPEERDALGQADDRARAEGGESRTITHDGSDGGKARPDHGARQ
jgi:membrane protein